VGFFFYQVFLIELYTSVFFSLKGVVATLENERDIGLQSLTGFQKKWKKEVERHESCAKIILDKTNEVESLRNDGDRLRLSVKELSDKVEQFKMEAIEIVRAEYWCFFFANIWLFFFAGKT
jgi:hypothetical protein